MIRSALLKRIVLASPLLLIIFFNFPSPVISLDHSITIHGKKYRKIRRPQNNAQQGCVDSESEFTYSDRIKGKWKQITATCENVKENKSLCEKHVIQRNCPITCVSCPERCEDQPGEIIITGVALKCDDDQAINYCNRLKFAKYCPVKCDFCPTLAPTVSSAPTAKPILTLKAEKPGLFPKESLGLQVTMSSDGESTFAVEKNWDDNTIDVLEYSGIKERWMRYVTRLTRIQSMTRIITSYDGKSVLVAFKGQKVELHQKTNDTWSMKHSFSKEYAQGLDISADGNTILMSSKTSVRVYDLGNGKYRKPLLHSGNGETDVERIIMHASMTSDGTIVAIAESNPTSIQVYEWSDGSWNKIGNGISPSNTKRSSNFAVVKIVDSGKTLFASKPGNFKRRGAIQVFDLHVDGREKLWMLREYNNGLVIKGKRKTKEQLGRNLSVSDDGKYVAWSSMTRVGVMKWTGSHWIAIGVENTSEKPQIALDPLGKNLAVGLPFKSEGYKKKVGAMNLYEWLSKNDPHTRDPSTQFPTRRPISSSVPSFSMHPSSLASPSPSSVPSSSTRPSQSPSSAPSSSMGPSPQPSLYPSITHLPSNNPTWCFHGDCI